MSSQPQPSTTYPHVAVGHQSLPVYPQRIGYLRNRIEKAVDAIQGKSLDFASFGDFVSAGPEVVHPFLGIFYPSLMPLWQFAGYGSQDEYDRSLAQPVLHPESGEQDVDDEGDLRWAPGEDTYDPDRDQGPDIAQIIEAFEAAFKANRLDLAKGLKTWVPFDEARAWVRIKTGEWLDGERARSREKLSRTTSSTSGS